MQKREGVADIKMTRRVLGHLAQAHSALAEATVHLQEALQICATLHL